MPKTKTFDVDIAQEFKDVKTEISGLKREINAWRNTVESQLTKLNSNMDRVLSQLADHEGRLTKLETDSIKSLTKKEAVSDFVKFGWWAGKLVFAAGVAVGGLFGAAQVLKVLFQH